MPKPTKLVVHFDDGSTYEIPADGKEPAALVLGKRIGFQKGILKPHNVPLTLLESVVDRYVAGRRG